MDPIVPSFTIVCPDCLCEIDEEDTGVCDSCGDPVCLDCLVENGMCLMCASEEEE